MGSSKQAKPDSVLEVVGSDRPLRDAVITWLDAELEEITVPTVLPEIRRRDPGARVSKIRQIKELPAAQAESLVVGRMLDLLRELHPSTFKQTAEGEDPRDPRRGIKFSYRDRSEPCYTGDVHSGQNLRLWVDASDDVWAQCFSPSCPVAHRLGCLHGETEGHLDGAVHVNMRYLARHAFVARPDTIEGRLAAMEEPGGEVLLNRAIDRWLAGDFKILSIQSGLGTAKTTLMNQICEERFGDKRILVVTYRQSLAMELSGSKLRGFVNYLDVPASHDKTVDRLWDRSLYPRVVCQYNSMWRLAEKPRLLPLFDLVILDEVMSLLDFSSARILVQPSLMIGRLVNTMKVNTTHALTLDALWGEQAFQLFRKTGFQQQLVVNDWRPTEPRTFRFTKQEAVWQARIAADLLAGLNVVVVSMSTEALHRLKDFVRTNDHLPAKDILIHTAKGADVMKRRLAHVDSLWSQYRLVGYSPCVEAGVDFSRPHFHRLYCYCCLQSTTPLAFVQVRQVPYIVTAVPRKICLPASAPASTQRMVTRR